MKPMSIARTQAVVCLAFAKRGLASNVDTGFGHEIVEHGQIHDESPDEQVYETLLNRREATA